MHERSLLSYSTKRIESGMDIHRARIKGASLPCPSGTTISRRDLPRMRKNQVLFLGTGASAGVPMIGCSCSICTSPLSQNKRRRSSVLLTLDGKKILIDAGPDLREQALFFHINKIDALLLTHPHADHIGGMDDLRAFNFATQAKIPCYLSEDTLREVKIRYHYFLNPVSKDKSIPAQLSFHLLPNQDGKIMVEEREFFYFSFSQAGVPVTGFRTGDFAYVSDIKEYNESIFDSIKGVQILVLSALRHAPSKMHFTVKEALAFASRAGAKQTILTHLSHELGYEETNALLPSSVQMGYDGLTLGW